MKIQSTWGAKTIDRAVDSPSTIRVGASDMEMDGFIDDTFSEYRQRSVVRREPGGSLSFKAPACGPRYLGFVMFDSVYSEEVEVCDRRGEAGYCGRGWECSAGAPLHAH